MLPNGFEVRLADDAIVLGGGAALVGGSPLTALRLSPRARQCLAGRRLTVRDPVSAQVAERMLATNLAQPDLTNTTVPSPADLTVVIPVRDRPHQLDRCLASLAGLACVVVDDASVDAHAVAHVAQRHGAALVPLKHNVGPAAARNIGLAQVHSPYVAFVDSDVQVATTDLLRLARHFTDPAVVLVGPRVLGRSALARPRWYARYETRDSSLTLGNRPGSVRPGAAVAWLPSACLVARTTELGEGFDGRRRVGEDVDLVWRLTATGRRVRYDPDIQAHHEIRSSMRAWLGRKAFYGTGSACLAVRHGKHVAPAALSPSFALAAAALLARTRCALPLATVALVRGRRSLQRALPTEPGAAAVATWIAARGLGWAVRQESALLLRHWWPAAALASVLSRRTRRALVTALAVDLAAVMHETTGLPTRDLPAHFSARRLDDLAYGAGLWLGALRTRSATALMPRWLKARPEASRHVRRPTADKRSVAVNATTHRPAAPPRRLPPAGMPQHDGHQSLTPDGVARA